MIWKQRVQDIVYWKNIFCVLSLTVDDLSFWGRLEKGQGARGFGGQKDQEKNNENIFAREWMSLSKPALMDDVMKGLPEVLIRFLKLL